MYIHKMIIITFLFCCFIPLTAQDTPPEADAPSLTPEAVKEAEKLVEEIYKNQLKERNPDKIRELISELITEGDKDSNDSATRYVLLSKAAELASRIGAVSETMEAYNKLRELTGQSQAENKMNALKILAKSARTPETLKEMAEIYYAFSSELEVENKYGEAISALKIAYSFAGKAKDKDLKTAIANRKKELAAAEKEFERAQKALKILSSKPDDPKANLAAGNYFCFIKGDWDTGLPYLALGSDTKMKSAAGEDITLSGMSEEDLGWSKDKILKLADRWYAIANKERDKLVQGMIAARSSLWYSKALAMTEGLKKKLIEDKLKKAEKLAAGASAVSAGSIPYGAISIVTFNKNTIFEKDGHTWIKNLANEELHYRMKHGEIVLGKAGEGLKVPAGKEGTYQIPYQPKRPVNLPYTISIWVKFKKIEEGGYVTFLGGTQGELGSSWFSGIRFRIMQSDGGAGSTYTEGRHLLKSGEWAHVVLIATGKDGEPFSDKNITFYVNGKNPGTSKQGKGAICAYGIQQSWFGSEPFEGILDEFAIWNRALSEKEVLQVYSMGKAGKTLK